MTTPTANDYAAALAAFDGFAAEGDSPEDQMFNALLTYIRARLAADEAGERYIELAKRGGYGDNPNAMNKLDRECNRLYTIALDAYRALVALAAGASEAAP